MVFDFLFKKKKEEEEKAAAGVPSASSEKKEEKKAKKEGKKETIEERIEREMQALPSFIRNKIKDPSIKQKFIELAKRMEKDGVDMNSPKQMKKWVKDHEKELKNEQNGKVETVVKGKEPGRNDPCPCGSGKKYKKCCGR
ncbi:MAG: SEC-C metal-binding domain-containing protein [Elusimicrobia bacterium]|nr:SEC-C metal-binding domain-containing protein [Elusimicrobiota bacterium]